MLIDRLLRSCACKYLFLGDLPRPTQPPGSTRKMPQWQASAQCMLCCKRLQVITGHGRSTRHDDVVAFPFLRSFTFVQIVETR